MLGNLYSSDVTAVLIPVKRNGLTLKSETMYSGRTQAQTLAPFQ